MIKFHGLQLRPSAATDALLATDWSTTGLGDPGGWSAALRTAIQLCLNSRFPMTLIWGQGLVTVYNDGFVPIMAGKHPGGFAQPVGQVYPELVDALRQPLQAVLRGGESLFEADRRLPLLRDGRLEEAYFTFSYSPVNDEHGVTQGVLAVATETTAQVLQQRRSANIGWLAEELAKLAALDPASPVMRQALAANPSDFAASALVEVAADGSYEVEWSEPGGQADALVQSLLASGLLGKLRELRRGSTLTRLECGAFALVMVDDEALNGRAYALLVQPGEWVRVDAGYLNLLGTLRETLSGAVYRIFAERAALVDVTRRLGERDRLYRLLFERSEDGILICSPGGAITAANPAACALLGFDERELCVLGRDGIVVSSAERLARCMAERGEQGAFAGELEFRHRDRGAVTVDVSSTIFFDDDTGEQRAITLFRDAAPRLLTQERVASTARLEAVGALTGGIAHDFNNLLNVIINGAEDLVDRLPGSGDAQASADMVLAAALRAAELTRQLLAFSRQQPMAARTVDVSSVVNELDQMLSRTMGGTIDVTTDAGAGTWALTDPTLLQSAILNLCINARDAMPHGGALRVEVGTVAVAGILAGRIELEPGDYVRIRVADTGVGIPTENLGRILEPFFTTKAVGHGTGLGLSMVFGFARQSGGSMHVQSEPGRGTEVDLYLPVSTPAESGAVADTKPAPVRAGRIPLAGRRVLVVEDERLLATMLARILEDAGFMVTLCHDGESALRVLAGETGGEPRDHSVVLTDILLGGGMDGWTLQRHVETRWPGLPVVTMSGFTAAGPERGPGRAPTLQKPFRPRDVLAVLDDALA